MLISNLFSNGNAGASDSQSLWQRASSFFAAIATRITGRNDPDAVLPFEAQYDDDDDDDDDDHEDDEEWSESDDSLDATDFDSTPSQSTACFKAADGSQTNSSLVHADQIDDINDELDSEVNTSKDEVEEVLWLESLDVPDDDVPKHSLPPNGNGYKYPKGYAPLYEAKPNKDRLSKYTVMNVDGSSKARRSSILSGSTSGVYSSLHTNSQESKRETGSLYTKFSSTLEANEKLSGDNQKINTLRGSQGSSYDGSQDSEPSKVVFDPCYVPEIDENYNEVTIHHTIVSPRVEEHTIPKNNSSECNEASFSHGSLKNTTVEREGLTDRQRNYVTEDLSEPVGGEEEDDDSLTDEGIPLSGTFIGSDIFGPSPVTAESEEELQHVEIHEYFELQRRSLCGQYRTGPIAMYTDPYEIEREIEKMDSKIEIGQSGAMNSVNAFHTESEGFQKEYFRPINPIMLEDDDEEFIAEELEYSEKRELCSYHKYTLGPFYSHPVPMDDILEHRINFQEPSLGWVLPDIAGEYHADSLTAVVPFAIEMREEDREFYSKQELTLKEKIRAKFRKVKGFFSRKNRRIQPMPIDEQLPEGENGQEAFMVQVGGVWNICYEAEATYDGTGEKVMTLVSAGQYQPPNNDNVRKVIAKNPNLDTISEEWEQAD